MSNNNQAAAAISPEEIAALHQEISTPLFFYKLAESWNISPETPTQADQFLQLAKLTGDAVVEQRVKSADARDPFLDKLIGEFTATQPAAVLDPETMRKAAAEILNTNATVNKAVNKMRENLGAVSN